MASAGVTPNPNPSLNPNPHPNPSPFRFANLGYADFVINGFDLPEVKSRTLVISLDLRAHELLSSAGFVSYYDGSMPTIPEAGADHFSPGFMDIMKLRLLYLAEILLRGCGRP